MKVLVLISDRTVPTVTGTRVRNHYLWPAMQKLGLDIQILAINLDRNEKKPQGPLGISSQFTVHQRRPLPIRLFKSLTKSFQEWPRSQAFSDKVMKENQIWKPDIIHAEELRMAYYLPVMQNKISSAKQTITFHNVETDLLKKTGSSPFALGRPIVEKIHQSSMKSYEKKAVNAADLCFAYSKVDQQKYKNLYPSGHWVTTLNGTQALSISPKAQVDKNHLLIVGSLSYAPNIRGLNWFLQKILPRLPDDFKVTVAGSRATQDYITELKKHKINFVDTPPKLSPYFQDCTLCVVPVFEGSGTRGKILESLAEERMIITTKLGTEGLNFSPSEGVVTAENENDFLQAILQWSKNSNDRTTPAQLGRQKVIDQFDWSVVAKQQKQHWESLCKS